MVKSILVNDVTEELRPANMESYLRIQAYLSFAQALDGVTYIIPGMARHYLMV